MTQDKPPVLMVALQIANRANGGIESFTQLLCGLQRYRPVVLTNVENRRTSAWRAAGATVHVVIEQASGISARRGPIRHLSAYFRYMREVRRLARSEGTRLVYVNDPLAMQFLQPLAATGRIHALFCLRNMPDPGIRQSPRKYRTLFNASRHLFFLSRDMEERWRRMTGGFTPPATVTYSAVDDSLLQRPPAPGIARGVVLVPARITPPKQQLDFIRNVLPRLVSAGLKVEFAGDASSADAAYEAECRAAAAPYGDAVEFLGFREDLPDLYARSAVVVVAARLEGLARAMIEAMACGCPVVSFDVCSAHEVLDSGAGEVVPAGDWPAMADAIVGLCKDSERRAQAGRIGQDLARRLFDTVQVVERYEQAFDQVSRAGNDRKPA